MHRRPEERLAPDHLTHALVVLCCGNALVGDDGFGPAVAERLLRRGHVPPHAVVLDVGTAIRGLLVDIELGEPRPQCVVVVDAGDHGGRPGEIAEIDLDAVAAPPEPPLSPHAAPTLQVLKQLEARTGIDVTAFVCQTASTPALPREGLSPPVAAAVEILCDRIERRFFARAASAIGTGAGRRSGIS